MVLLFSIVAIRLERSETEFYAEKTSFVGKISRNKMTSNKSFETFDIFSIWNNFALIRIYIGICIVFRFYAFWLRDGEKKTEVPTKRFICESLKCLSATIQCHIFVGKHVKCGTKVGYELVFRFQLKEEEEIWMKKENRRLFYF